VFLNGPAGLGQKPPGRQEKPAAKKKPADRPPGCQEKAYRPAAKKKPAGPAGKAYRPGPHLKAAAKGGPAWPLRNTGRRTWTNHF
jgi:hypothetical protein